MKIRCSALPKVTTSSRSKSDPVSETTKTYIRELWIENSFNRKNEVITKFMNKGIEVEDEAISLYSLFNGADYKKNEQFYENDYLTGTPDIIGDEIIDIKNSWNIWTFASMDEKKALKEYEAQLLGYMILTGVKKARIVHCLINTPDHIVQDELYKISFQFKGMTQSELENKFSKNYIFDDIPLEQRFKETVVEYSDEKVEKLKEKVDLAINYYNSIERL